MRSACALAPMGLAMAASATDVAVDGRLRGALREGDAADDLEVLALAPDEGVGGDARGLGELVVEALLEGADDEARDEEGAGGGEQEGEHDVGRDDLPADVARRIADERPEALEDPVRESHTRKYRPGAAVAERASAESGLNLTPGGDSDGIRRSRSQSNLGAGCQVAEGVGFEPTVTL